MGNNRTTLRVDHKKNKSIIVHPKFMHTLPPSTPLVLQCGWEKLPLEVLFTIASHMTTARELCLFGRISHASSIAARDERLWKQLCVSKFAVSQHCTPPSWRELYAFNHEMLRMCLRERGRSSHTAYEYGSRGYLHVRIRV